MQDGFKELLLCDRCEQQLGRYEKYARDVLFDKNGPVLKRPSGAIYQWMGLDYSKLKLFQMSVLWRMGISVHPCYSHVNLGKHEDHLRKMLLAEDPGEPWQYGCTATLLTHAREPVLGLFSQPRKTKFWGHIFYRLVLAGIHLDCLVSSHRPGALLCQTFLNPTGTWILYQAELCSFAYLRPQVMEFRQQHEGATP